jgi:hypothetical protein
MLGGIAFKLIGLLGGDVFGRVADAVAEHFRAKANAELARHQAEIGADTQVALARIQAELEARRVQAQILQADRGWWVTRWIRPLLVYPCVLHFAAIVLDSTLPPYGSWGIARLPAPYDLYEQAIILSFFIARPFEKAARVFSAGRRG